MNELFIDAVPMHGKSCFNCTAREPRLFKELVARTLTFQGVLVRYLVSAMLIIVATIHLLPLSGVLGGPQLSVLYGIPFDEPNLEILMRHRAVLFGLLGAFLLVAAFRPTFQLAAFIAGFVSVLSFLFLAWSVGSYNKLIGRVFAADIIALGCLILGAAAYAYIQRSPDP